MTELEYIQFKIYYFRKFTVGTPIKYYYRAFKARRLIEAIKFSIESKGRASIGPL